MNVGDLCSIWDGVSPIADPKSWPIGVVSKARKEPHTGIRQFQVHWPDGKIDRTWYREREIRVVNRPESL